MQTMELSVNAKDNKIIFQNYELHKSSFTCFYFLLRYTCHLNGKIVYFLGLLLL